MTEDYYVIYTEYSELKSESLHGSTVRGWVTKFEQFESYDEAKHWMLNSTEAKECMTSLIGPLKKV